MRNQPSILPLSILLLSLSCVSSTLHAQVFKFPRTFDGQRVKFTEKPSFSRVPAKEVFIDRGKIVKKAIVTLNYRGKNSATKVSFSDFDRFGLFKLNGNRSRILSAVQKSGSLISIRYEITNTTPGTKTNNDPIEIAYRLKFNRLFNPGERRFINIKAATFRETVEDAPIRNNHRWILTSRK